MPKIIVTCNDTGIGTDFQYERSDRGMAEYLTVIEALRELQTHDCTDFEVVGLINE